MADWAEAQQTAPVPKPRPRKARTGLVPGSVDQQSQTEPPAPAERRSRASESDSLQPEVVAAPPDLEHSISTGRPWTGTAAYDSLNTELQPPQHMTSCDGGPASTSSDIHSNSHLQHQLHSLADRLTSLRSEEAELCERVRVGKRECEEVERRLGEMRGEEQRLRRAMEERLKVAEARLKRGLTELEGKVGRLKEEEARLTLACEERERQRSALATESSADDTLRERELEVQRQLSEASDREAANRQEHLRLQRLADQLHMQKKALDHREFDLENFADDSIPEEKMAELREREHRQRQREGELDERERETDRRQTNFQQWMREQQNSIEQRLSELSIGDPAAGSSVVPPTASSYHHTHTVTHPQGYVTQQFTPSQLSHLPQSSSFPHFPVHNVSYSSHYEPSYPPQQFSQSYDGAHYGNNPGYYTAIQPKYPPPHRSPAAYYSPTSVTPSPQVTSSHPPPLTHSTQSSSAGSSTQRENSANHSYNDLGSLPPPIPLSLPSSPPPPPSSASAVSSSAAVAAVEKGSLAVLAPGIIKSGRAAVGLSGVGVVSGGVGVVSSGVGVVGDGRSVATSSQSPRNINIDEEVAYQMREVSPPNQSTDDISADAELARKLQHELNTGAVFDQDRDRQLALAMMAVGNEVTDFSNIDELIANRLMEVEERKRQMERDAELARTLEEPGQETTLNDLGS